MVDERLSENGMIIVSESSSAGAIEDELGITFALL